MSVYEPVSAEKKTEMLSHLQMLSRFRRPDDMAVGPEERGSFNPDLISNIRQFGYTPSPRQLHLLSQNLSLTIGGAFKLFGYSLEGMRHLDFLLNGARTRLIETYPFYRDRPVDVPELLAEESAFQENSFLSDLVRSWRRQIPIRTIYGPHWRRRRLLYAQIGTGDGMALPTIPPGSVVAIGEIDEKERRHPDPQRYYFLQHRAGYSCCRCVVDRGRLLLLTPPQRVDTPQEFVYPGQVRIVGRVVSFATRLPVPMPEPIFPRRAQVDTPLIFPWEHTSFSALLQAEEQRFGITDAHLHSTRNVLEEQLGIRLSSRTVRRYKHGGKHMPRTSALLALIAVHSLRPTDAFRLLKLWSPMGHQLSLTTLIKARNANELAFSFEAAPAPNPAMQWQQLLERWGEWPNLLSMTFPHLAILRDNLLRLCPDRQFRGLDPLIRRGSVILLDQGDISPPRNGEAHQEAWNRPIYAVRCNGETHCGYLEASTTHFALQPLPASGVPRLVSPIGQVQVMGRVSAVASPL